jgi:hypothetical protein
LAIADDLGAVLVIALFYTDRIWVGPLVAAGVSLALIVLASRMKITRPAVYGLLIIGVWLGVFLSGIHATVAGILLALAVPVRGRLRPKRFFAIAREKPAELEASNLSGEVTKLSSKQMEIFERLHEATREVVPAGPAFERYLHPLTAYVVLPLRAASGVKQDAANLMARVYAANTLGAIAGALGASLLLIAWIGSQRAEQVLIVLSAISGLLLLNSGARWVRLRVAAVAVLLAMFSIRSVPPVAKVLIAYGRYAASWVGKGDIIYAREGMNSSVAVSRFSNGAETFHVAGII